MKLTNRNNTKLHHASDRAAILVDILSRLINIAMQSQNPRFCSSGWLNINYFLIVDFVVSSNTEDNTLKHTKVHLTH